jgi:hypothetical protein
VRDEYHRIKNSAKRRGIEFDLKFEDLALLSIPVTCPALGIPLKKARGRRTDNSPSVDRIDSTKGYLPDNIVVVSWRANKIKSNATLDELRRIVSFYETI